MLRLSPIRFGLLLLVAGTLLRLLLVLALRGEMPMPEEGTSADDSEFNALAKNVAAGNGFRRAEDSPPTSFRAPGWPLFVAGLYAAFGERAWVVYLASCVLGGVSCVLAWLIARRLTGEGVARIAGLLCVVFLPHAYFVVMFWSENLFVPLFAAAVWLLVRSTGVPPVASDTGGTPVLREFVLAGLLLGAAALTRPFALLAVPLFALVLVARFRWRGLLAGAVLGLTTTLVVTPWTYRNYLVHHHFVPVATNGGSTFYGGNNERVVSERRQYGSWISTTELPGRDEIEAAPDEVAHDKVEWDLGFRWIRANPGKALLLLPLKLLRLILWLPDFGLPAPLPVRAASWLPFLALIAVGLWRGRKEMTGPGWRLLHASLLATALTALIFWGSPRFRDANAPLLMVYAAMAFAGRKSRRAKEGGWA